MRNRSFVYIKCEKLVYDDIMEINELFEDPIPWVVESYDIISTYYLRMEDFEFNFSGHSAEAVMQILEHHRSFDGNPWHDAGTGHGWMFVRLGNFVTDVEFDANCDLGLSLEVASYDL